jgi:uncharacterized phage protein (TIGR02218 family)
MSRVWFAEELETAATFWRLMRRDGVTLGFTTHDRDLWFDGLLHRAAPGMVPSAIRRSAGFEPDSAEVQGALTHDSLSASDLAAGRFDQARVAIGLVDWQTLERHTIYRGTIGSVTEQDNSFAAELQSSKVDLGRDPTPRTAPGCRAAFCGPGCTLSPARFSHSAMVSAIDPATNSVTAMPGAALDRFVGGSLRWLDGPHAGTASEIIGLSGSGLVLEAPLDQPLVADARVLLREGCDRTLATCATRFANAINFQGEPFLPGNDSVARYPSPVQ